MKAGSEEARQIGVGISGVRVRLEQLGGRLDIRSGPAGTHVSAKVPITPVDQINRFEQPMSQDAFPGRLGSIARAFFLPMITISSGAASKTSGTACGLGCAEAANGREAVELALQHRPHVAVIDLSMPELNGLEATRRIRQSLPDTEVSDLHNARERGADQGGAGCWRPGLPAQVGCGRQHPGCRKPVAEKPYFAGRVSGLSWTAFLKGDRRRWRVQRPSA